MSGPGPGQNRPETIMVEKENKDAFIMEIILYRHEYHFIDYGNREEGLLYSLPIGPSHL